MIPAKPPHVKWKKTGRTGILLNLITGDFYELDDAAIAIWKAVDGRTSAAGIVKKLAAVYATPPGLMEKDVTHFLAELQKRKLIDRRGK